MKHKHHIIPKHIGGSDDPENLVELTVEEHAEAHRKLFEEHGRWQDKIAWKMLSGQIGKEEGSREARILYMSGDKNPMRRSESMEKRKQTMKSRGIGPWNKGKTKEEHSGLQKLSEYNKLYREQGRLPNIGDFVRGTKFSEEHKNSLRESAKKVKKIFCDHCGGEFRPANFARWHGINCQKSK